MGGHHGVMKDDITHAIAVSVPIEKLWSIVSVPGWWILDTEVQDHRITPDGDDAVIVHDEKWGDFRIGIADLDAPRRAVFTWLPDEGAAPMRVQFTLASTENGSELEVHETGFAAMTPEQYEVQYPANLEGWVVALKAAALAATRA